MDANNKTLEEMLLEHAGKPGSGLAAKNYAAFLARWDEICAAYEKGWSYADIWKTLKAEGIFTFSYPAFTGYVRKIRRRRNEAEANRKEGRAVMPPGSTRVDLPVFGSEVKSRPERRF